MKKHYVRLNPHEVYLVRVLLKQSDLTQSEIARRNGVSQPTISRIATRKHRFS